MAQADTPPLVIRAIEPGDQPAWLPLWDGYNAFYGRAGATALAPAITQATWQRFFDANEPVFALVAQRGTELLGLVHCLYHRSTWVSSFIHTTCDGAAATLCNRNCR